MPDADDFSLLIDLHRRSPRQGPGGRAEVDRALALANPPKAASLRVLDIGCGTGESALHLSRCLDAEITAVDIAPEFIRILEKKAKALGAGKKLNPIVASMDNLPFGDRTFDLLWSEGAIYNIGFERGVTTWRRLLDTDGILVVSEITWTTASRPKKLQAFWQSQYPEIDTASGKIAVLERSGYSPLGYFVLPEHCWLENYYLPLQASFPAFLERHTADPRAAAIVEQEKQEIAFYNEYKPYYGYGVYIARKV